MAYGNGAKNPFFLPALIAALIPPVILVFFFYCAGVLGIINRSLTNLLFFLLFITSVASIILSIAGLVYAKKPQKPFIGCVFCFALSFLEVLFVLVAPAYLSKPHRHPEYTIKPHTLSPEESAVRESTYEVINRALKGNTNTGTSTGGGANGLL